MGMDIALAVEARDATGAWDVIHPPGRAAHEDPYEWELWRNYQCFSMMTGKPIGSWLIDPIPAIADERGLPSDLSEAAAQRLHEAKGVEPDDASWPDEAVAASWLDLSDFDRFDWDAPIVWNYMALPPPGTPTLTEAMRSEVLAHVERHVLPPKGWRIAGGPPPRLSISAPTTPRFFAQQLLDFVEDMRLYSTGAASDIRCVFIIDF